MSDRRKSTIIFARQRLNKQDEASEYFRNEILRNQLIIVYQSTAGSHDRTTARLHDRMTARLLLPVDNLPVPDLQNAVRHICQLPVVGDNYYGLSEGIAKPEEELVKFIFVFRVKVA